MASTSVLFFSSVHCERLEERIAPATLVDGSTVSYVDADGDQVTMKFSKPVFGGSLSLEETILFTAAGEGERLDRLDLTSLGAKEFRGLNITVTVLATGGGDGLVEIGQIDAAGIDLGKVTVAGRLASVLAGDARLTTKGLHTLDLVSLGGLQGDEAMAADALVSVIAGGVKNLRVSQDMEDAVFQVVGGRHGGIQKIEVGGSLIGGDAEFSGSIRADGPIGQVQMGGDLRGGQGDQSGQIFSKHRITQVQIEGDIVGGEGKYSGSVKVEGNLARVEVGGSLIGSISVGSGSLYADRIGRVNIDGDMVGAGGAKSGGVFGKKGVSGVRVEGDMLGHFGASSGGVSTGEGRVGRVIVEGAASAGSGLSSGDVLEILPPPKPKRGTMTICSCLTTAITVVAPDGFAPDVGYYQVVSLSAAEARLNYLPEEIWPGLLPDQFPAKEFFRERLPSSWLSSSEMRGRPFYYAEGLAWDVSQIPDIEALSESSRLIEFLPRLPEAQFVSTSFSSPWLNVAPHPTWPGLVEAAPFGAVVITVPGKTPILWGLSQEMAQALTSDTA